MPPADDWARRDRKRANVAIGNNATERALHRVALGRSLMGTPETTALYG